MHNNNKIQVTSLLQMATKYRRTLQQILFDIIVKAIYGTWIRIFSDRNRYRITCVNLTTIIDLNPRNKILTTLPHRGKGRIED